MKNFWLDRIKVGDVVQSRITGRRMTVNSVGWHCGSYNYCECIWFDENSKLCKAVCFRDHLIKVRQ